jgi:hypothetical protein
MLGVRDFWTSSSASQFPSNFYYLFISLFNFGGGEGGVGFSRVFVMSVTFANLCKIEVSWRARGSERRATALFSSPAVATLSGTLA